MLRLIRPYRRPSGGVSDNWKAFEHTLLGGVEEI
jgi:hypothetical protein